MRKARKADTEHLTGYTLASRGIPPLFPSEPLPGAREIDLTGCVLTVDVMPADRIIPAEPTGHLYGHAFYEPQSMPAPAFVAFPFAGFSHKPREKRRTGPALMALYV